MKKVKKLVSLLLVMVMAIGMMTITAFADGEKGTITIDNAVAGQTYTIYKILELESYDKDAGAYAYKATEAWSAFINSDTIKDVYVNVDDQGYVTWKEGASAADFAKIALQYAKNTENGISATETEKATSTTVTFTGLDLGYYLVDSSLGALCGLDTTNPNVTIKEKNEEPTIDKTVEEDSTGTYGDENDADIGQTVNFKTIVHAKKGAQNYVVHDVMSEGLTLNTDSIMVEGATKDTDYKVTFDAEDKCTFEIAFTQTYLDSIDSDKDITITYSAVLNEKAVISTNENTNKTKLDYGESSSTEWDTTTTYTWDMDVFKYTGTDTPLAGATFTLSKNANGTDPIALVSKGSNVYRVATSNDTDTVNKITTDATGKFTIEGLDSDTYYLTETKAPAGYNKLAEPVTVVIDDKGQTNVDSTEVNEVKVENNSGSELPSTGGIGTTIFYVLGAIMVIGAGVVLVSRKRMEK